MLADINAEARTIGTYLYGRRMYETMTGWETDPSFAAQSPESAAGTLASTFHAKAMTGTIRSSSSPSRAGRPAQLDGSSCTCHPGWPWQQAWQQLATTGNSPPSTA